MQEFYQQVRQTVPLDEILNFKMDKIIWQQWATQLEQILQQHEKWVILHCNTLVPIGDGNYLRIFHEKHRVIGVAIYIHTRSYRFAPSYDYQVVDYVTHYVKHINDLHPTYIDVSYKKALHN